VEGTILEAYLEHTGVREEGSRKAPFLEA